MGRMIMVIAGVVSISAGLAKLRAARRRPGTPAVRAMCVGLLAFGTAFLILAPTNTILVSRALHMANAGRLLGNILTLAAAGATQVMMLHLAHPAEVARPRARRRLVVLAGIAVAMTLLLASAHTANVTNFLEGYARYTPIAVYQLLYLSFLAAAVVDLILLSVRYSRHVGRMLRIGLRMVAVGGVLYAVHTGYKLLLVVAAWTGWSVPGDESTISTVLAAGGGLLIAGGTTLPVWGPRAALPWQWLRRYRSYRRLEPLWRHLSAAVPEVMLAGGASHPWKMGIRLYRRVIEIRDAQLLLKPYADPGAAVRAEEAARAEGLTGERAQAYVDASVLVAALARRGTAGADDPAALPSGDTAGDASLSRESRYLEHVAAAFVALTDRREMTAVDTTKVIQHGRS